MKTYTVTLTEEQWRLIDGALNVLGEHDREFIEFLEIEDGNMESIVNIQSEISDIDETQTAILNQIKEQG